MKNKLNLDLCRLCYKNRGFNPRLATFIDYYDTFVRCHIQSDLSTEGIVPEGCPYAVEHLFYEVPIIRDPSIPFGGKHD